MEMNLRIFTLNCWGIPVISQHRIERIQAIGEFLRNSTYNIVCLQEIWTEKDYLYLKQDLNDRLPFSHYFYSGVLGSGLCVFSKWPIQDVFFYQWPLNGYIHKIHHGDWFGGKGVGLCRIKYQDKIINVYCTHLHAEYNEDDMYLSHRVLQAYSAAEFVNITKASAAVCIFAGDLNTCPGELPFRLITELPQFIDPYDLEKDEFDDDDHVTESSGTCDSIRNSFSDPRQVKTHPEGKRIDHILFNIDASWQHVVKNFGNPLDDRIPSLKCSYSDHDAVMLDLHLRLSGNNYPNITQSNIQQVKEALEDALKVCIEAKATVTYSGKLYLTISGFIFFLLMATVSYWPNNLWYDLVKIFITGLCFYYLMMGTLWRQIEMNSLKAGISGIEHARLSRC